MQALGAGQVQIGFVDRRHLHFRREALQHFINLVRVFDVALAVAVDEDRLGAEFVGGPQGHGRVHAELARRVRCRRDHAALVGPPADHHRLAFERRIEQLFDGDEERVHVEMEVEFHGPGSSREDHPRQARQVGPDFHFLPRAQHSAHGVAQGVADFHHQPAAGREQSLGFGDQAAINLQAVVAAVERDVGFVVADLALDRSLVARRNIGRIRDHQIEARRSQSPLPRSQASHCYSRAEPAAIRRGDAQRRDRDVGADHASAGLERQRDGDRARSGSDIDDVPRAQLAARLR